MGPNRPLNVPFPSQGRQTNNSAEIDAATVGIQQAHEVGIKKLRIKTDSKFLVHSATEWIQRWEANDWRTYENKPVRNRSVFEKMNKHNHFTKLSKVLYPILAPPSMSKYHIWTTHLPLTDLMRTPQIQTENQLASAQTNLMSSNSGQNL